MHPWNNVKEIDGYIAADGQWVFITGIFFALYSSYLNRDIYIVDSCSINKCELNMYRPKWSRIR